MPTTKENLAEAFAGESQANQKYRAYAKAAIKDGFPKIAQLFETAAEAERIHAEGHFKALTLKTLNITNKKLEQQLNQMYTRRNRNTKRY